MKTLIKNKRSYKKHITSEDDNDRDNFMKDGEELEGDDDERSNDDKEGNEGENSDICEGLGGDGDEGRNKDEEGNEEENGDNHEGEGNGDWNFEADMYAEDGENAENLKEGNGDEDERVDVDDRSEVEAYVWDFERDAVAGFGATTSQLAAAKKLKKSAATRKGALGSEYRMYAWLVSPAKGRKKKKEPPNFR